LLKSPSITTFAAQAVDALVIAATATALSRQSFVI
jgi:hypothetical protein